MATPVHRARFPDPTGRFLTLPPEDQAYMRELVASLQREMDTGRAVAQGELLLLAPDGKAWSITVSTAGALVVTNVPFAPGGVP